tara:strand:+ start:1222 stop:3630 length:2409 start_codon:yes stop_codon:yes gene_type:complete
VARREFSELSTDEALLVYPAGPFATDADQLASQIQDFCGDVTTAGGGASRVRRCGRTMATGSIGTLQRFGCGEDGCKFKLRYEFTYSGWGLYDGNPCHNDHELEQEARRMALSAPARKIPDDFYWLGRLLAKSGLPAKTIQQVFKTRAKEEGIEYGALYPDVYNAFVRGDSTLDATGLVTMLRAREYREGLLHFIEVDEENCITRTFVEVDGARKIWGTDRINYRLGNVLMFDATFGTNQYGLKLSLFLTVDEDGSSRVLAYLVHAEESAADVYWALRCFHAVFKIPPASFMTDSGPGILLAASWFIAVGQEWDLVAHILCIFHLDKNFYGHIHSLFASNTEGWRTVHDKFWLISKRADWSAETLNAKFLEMRTYVAKHGKGKSSTKTNALAWLDDLERRMPQFAAHFTWHHFTAGCHATSRIEGTIGSLKRTVGANCKLTELHERMEDFHISSEAQGNARRERLRLKHNLSTAVRDHLPIWLSSVKDFVSAFAFQHLQVQASMSMGYGVDMAVSDEGGRVLKIMHDYRQPVFKVTPNRVDSIEPPDLNDDGSTKCYECDGDDGLLEFHNFHFTCFDYCTCDHLECHGVPCRHILAVRSKWHNSFEAGVCKPLLSLFNVRYRVKFDLPLYAEGHSEFLNRAALGRDVCYHSFCTALNQVGFEPRDINYDTDFTVRAYGGWHVAIKYGRKPTSGNWHIGTITLDRETPELLEDLGPLQIDDNECELFFQFSDKTYARFTLGADCLLPASAIANDQQHPQFSWMLLQRQSLSNDTGDEINNPRSSRGHGRPQSKRLRPHSGPTS